MPELSKEKENRRINLGLIRGLFKSQRELADAIDQSPSYVNQMLNGHRAIGEKTARKIEWFIGLRAYSLDFKQKSVNDMKRKYLISHLDAQYSLPASDSIDISVTNQTIYISHIQWHELELYLNSNYNKKEEFKKMPINKVVSENAFIVDITSNQFEPYVSIGEMVVIEPIGNIIETIGKKILIFLNGRYMIVDHQIHETNYFYPVRTGSTGILVNDNLDYELIGVITKRIITKEG